MTTPQKSSSKSNTGLASQPLKTNSSLKTEIIQRPTSAPAPTPSNMPQKLIMQPAQQKKVSRRSSKPFINWFQRKLAGSGKAKQTENHPLAAAQFTTSRNNSTLNRQMGRIVSTPLPVPAVKQLNQQSKPDGASYTRRKTHSISVNGEDEPRESYGPEDDISDQFSLNRDSIRSPASALEADDDASVRPLPPSSPPSPSPSRDSSSYLSDPNTFRSIAASTKPTTLLSIDMNGGGMAHIAQVPPSQTTQIPRSTSQARQSPFGAAGILNSGASVTFSALPNPQSPSQPSSVRNPGGLNPIEPMAEANGAMTTVQAPLHTAHHPRNNPRPSSPPLDNASVLTLASSAFASPSRPGILNYPPSATVGDSTSHYGGSIAFPDGESTSNYLLGDDERLEERDVDASVRALRPRSSRRGSWESEVSRWSARVQGAGTPSLLRDRALWTSGSIRTGGLSIENGEITDIADERTPETAMREIESEKEVVPEFVIDVQSASPTPGGELAVDSAPTATSGTTSSHNLDGSQVLRPPSADTIGQTTSLSA